MASMIVEESAVCLMCAWNELSKYYVVAFWGTYTGSSSSEYWLVLAVVRSFA